MNINKLNKKIEKQVKDATIERNERVAPLAQKVIKIIADANLPVGDVHAHDNPKFSAVAREVVSELMDSDARHIDITALFQFVIQPFDMIGAIVKESLAKSFNDAESKLFGKDYSTVTLKDLDDILRSYPQKEVGKN